MTKNEVMQMALDALDEYVPQYDKDNNPVGNTIDALRAALAQPEPEPVAWVWEINELSQLFLTLPQGWNPIPLYTAPPQRKEWVGLTDADVDYAVAAIYKGFDMAPRNQLEATYFERVVRYTEAELKEKNT